MKENHKNSVQESESLDCLYRQFGGYSEGKQNHTESLWVAIVQMEKTYVHAKG